MNVDDTDPSFTASLTNARSLSSVAKPQSVINCRSSPIPICSVGKPSGDELLTSLIENKENNPLPLINAAVLFSATRTSYLKILISKDDEDIKDSHSGCKTSQRSRHTLGNKLCQNVQ